MPPIRCVKCTVELSKDSFDIVRVLTAHLVDTWRQEMVYYEHRSRDRDLTSIEACKAEAAREYFNQLKLALDELEGCASNP